MIIMTDKLTKEQRSYCMSRIRSKWTKQEVKAHNWLKGHKIKHKMHPKIEGSPDIILREKRVAIFLNGCFWHKCPNCYKEPKSRRKFWVSKIEKNIRRDRQNMAVLKKNEWKVLIFWEHDIKKNFEIFARKIKKVF